MPEESTTPDLVALTRQVVDAFGRGDIEAIVAFGAHDGVFEATALGTRFEGSAASRAFLEDWLGSFEDLAFELQEIHDLGNGVVLVVVHQSGRPVGTVGTVQQQEAWVIAWAERLMVQIFSYTDIDQARAAAERLAEERE